METLKIETTVKQAKDIEIPIPFFARTISKCEYIALLDANTFVTIYQSAGLAILRNGEVSEHANTKLIEALETWHSCTETEFLEKYDSVIASISLHPKLAV